MSKERETQQEVDDKRLERLEKLARNNRALLILVIVLLPLITFATLYSVDFNFKEGKLNELNFRSREISIPAETKFLISLFGLGGLFGLSKDELTKIIISRIQQKESNKE